MLMVTYTKIPLRLGGLGGKGRWEGGGEGQNVAGVMLDEPGLIPLRLPARAPTPEARPGSDFFFVARFLQGGEKIILPCFLHDNNSYE